VAYASAQDVIDRLGTQLAAELTTEGESSTTPDSAMIGEHISGAEAVVDSYLTARYRTPVSVGSQPSIAALLKRYTLDVAIHSLYGRALDIPQAIQERYDAAIAFLKDVQKGVASLPIEGAEVAESAYQPTAIVTDGDDRGFTRKTLEGL
jgi:phage gp36-like protein